MNHNPTTSATHGSNADAVSASPSSWGAGPVPAPLEITHVSARGRAGAGVPSFEVLEWLTAVPEQRVVFRGVDWPFYEALVDAVPEKSGIHVDYDGTDLEAMVKGLDHEDRKSLPGRFVGLVAETMAIPCKGAGETTWKRPEIARGLEADRCSYFAPEKLAGYAAARRLGPINVADCPNPDLAIEIDISRPRVNRAGIYAALGVAEVWRLDDGRVIIERLTPEGSYAAVEASGFLPVRAEDVRRWVVEEDSATIPPGRAGCARKSGGSAAVARCEVRNSRFQIQDSEFKIGISDSRFQIQNGDFGFKIPNSKFQIPNSKFQIPNSKFQIQNPMFQVLDPKTAF